MKKDLSLYECCHGLGYSKIVGKRNGIKVQQLFFVPLDVNGK